MKTKTLLFSFLTGFAVSSATANTDSPGFSGVSVSQQESNSEDRSPTFSKLESFEFISLPAGTFYPGTHPYRVDQEITYTPVRRRMVSWSRSTGRRIHSQSYSPSPREEVSMKNGFELSKTEVTQEIWQEVMGTNPSRFKGNNRPVENIRYQDVLSFVRKLNESQSQYLYRLPTALEWEYAYRAGIQEHWPWQGLDNYKDYMDFDLESTPMLGVGVYCWIKGNTSSEELLERQGGEFLEQHQKVAIKPSNNWGFHDMCGNVAEFTSSRFELPEGVQWVDSQGKPVEDARQTLTVMGGSFKSFGSASSRLDSDFSILPGEKRSWPLSKKSYKVGFRLLRTPR